MIGDQAMGQVYVPSEWKPHPRFAGVFVKPLVTCEANPGLAVNLVRLAPGGEITPHVHPDSTETFYILKGSGVSWVDGDPIELAPGVCAYAPPAITHSVCNTGEVDLEALSMFNPPV